MSEPTVRPIWTPDDAQQTAHDAAEHEGIRGIPVEMRPRRARCIAKLCIAVGVLILVLATGALWATTARAAADAPGCATQFWLIPFQSNTRTICDGPIQADGSWLRAREFWSPAYTTNPTSSCYGSGYSSSCTYYPARFVPRRSQGVERYVVTPATVLGDEPGHLA